MSSISSTDIEHNKEAQLIDGNRKVNTAETSQLVDINPDNDKTVGEHNVAEVNENSVVKELDNSADGSADGTVDVTVDEGIAEARSDMEFLSQTESVGGTVDVTIDEEAKESEIEFLSHTESLVEISESDMITSPIPDVTAAENSAGTDTKVTPTPPVAPTTTTHSEVETHSEQRSDQALPPSEDRSLPTDSAQAAQPSTTEILSGTTSETKSFEPEVESSLSSGTELKNFGPNVAGGIVSPSSPPSGGEECTSPFPVEDADDEGSSGDEPPLLDDGLPEGADATPKDRQRTDSPFDIVQEDEIDAVKDDAERLIEEEKKLKEEEEENAKKQSEESNSEWLNVLGNDSLKKKVLVNGIGNTLEKGQQVTIRYSLLLASGQEVESNVEQTFTLGDGEVISAIDLCCNLAKVGEKFDIVSNSRFAYESYGKSPSIPPEASVLIQCEVLQSEDTLPVEKLNEEERVAIGDRKRKIGNDYFGRSDFANASKNYKCATKYLDPPSYKLDKDDSEATVDLKFKTWCNLALSELKACNIPSGLVAAERAIELKPDSSKAYYRKGKLLFEKGEFEEAQKVLVQASKIDPSSVGCKQFLKEISSTIATQKRKQQQMYKKMFNLEKNPESTSDVASSDGPSWLQSAIPMAAASIAVGAFAVAGYFGLKSLSQ